jgi:hypothetical protein
LILLTEFAGDREPRKNSTPDADRNGLSPRNFMPCLTSDGIDRPLVLCQSTYKALRNVEIIRRNFFTE